MEELQGAPVGTDRSRVAMGRGQRQMPGQEDRTVRGYRNQGLVPELEKVIRIVLADWANAQVIMYLCETVLFGKSVVFWECNIQ